MTYQETCDYLFSLPRFEKSTDAYKPGLGNMLRLMEAMGNPHRKLRCLHVAGTNGKGSTSAMLAAILKAKGYKVGLYTSPHLFDFAERLRINGQNITPEKVLALVAKWADVFAVHKPSFFEAITVLMFDYFAAEKVDIAVIETGLGGRLDATNIITPEVSLITNIGFDHTKQLGHTLAAIASEKAGIIKPNVPIFTTVIQPEALHVIADKANECHAPLTFVCDQTEIAQVEVHLNELILDLSTKRQSYPRLLVNYTGEHQAENVRLAVSVAEFLDCNEPEIREGLAHIKEYAGLRGRLDVLQTDPLIVADVAHNAEGLQTALHFIAEKAPHGQIFAIFGAMKDKDILKMAQLLSEYQTVVLPAEAETPRAYPKHQLADTLTSLDIRTQICDTVKAAVTWFKQHAQPEDALLITGSHQIVGQWHFLDPIK